MQPGFTNENTVRADVVQYIMQVTRFINNILSIEVAAVEQLQMSMSERAPVSSFQLQS